MPAFIVLLVSPGSLNSESSTFVGRNYRQFKQNIFNWKACNYSRHAREEICVYAHLLVTHQPFTFTATGEFRTEEKDSYESYKDQIRYTNMRLVEIVRTILEKSRFHQSSFCRVTIPTRMVENEPGIFRRIIYPKAAIQKSLRHSQMLIRSA